MAIMMRSKEGDISSVIYTPENPDPSSAQLEDDTQELLKKMMTLGGNPPRFQLKLIVRLSGWRRYKTCFVATEGYPEMTTILDSIYTDRPFDATFHRLLRKIHFPAVSYLDDAKTFVKEPSNILSSEFDDPRQMKDEDFDLSITFTVDQDLKNVIEFEVNDCCSDSLKGVLTEGGHRDGDTSVVWKPMKRVVYYVLHKTFTAVSQAHA